MAKVNVLNSTKSQQRCLHAWQFTVQTPLHIALVVSCVFLSGCIRPSPGITTTFGARIPYGDMRDHLPVPFDYGVAKQWIRFDGVYVMDENKSKDFLRPLPDGRGIDWYSRTMEGVVDQANSLHADVNSSRKGPNVYSVDSDGNIFIASYGGQGDTVEQMGWWMVRIQEGAILDNGETIHITREKKYRSVIPALRWRRENQKWRFMPLDIDMSIMDDPAWQEW